MQSFSDFKKQYEEELKINPILGIGKTSTFADMTQTIDLKKPTIYTGTPELKLEQAPKLTFWQKTKEAISKVFEPITTFVTRLTPRERAEVVPTQAEFRKPLEEEAKPLPWTKDSILNVATIPWRVGSRFMEGFTQMGLNIEQTAIDLSRIIKEPSKELPPPISTAGLGGMRDPIGLIRGFNNSLADFEALQEENNPKNNPLQTFINTQLAYYKNLAPSVADFLIVGDLINLGLKKSLTPLGQKAAKVNAAAELGYPKTLEEARIARNQIAQIYHPDKPMGNLTLFKRTQNAYELLQREGIPTQIEIKTVPSIRNIVQNLTRSVFEKEIPLETIGGLRPLAGALPGYRPEGGLIIRPIGGSIKPIEPVGFGKVISKVISSQEARDISMEVVPQNVIKYEPKIFEVKLTNELTNKGLSVSEAGTFAEGLSRQIEIGLENIKGIAKRTEYIATTTKNALKSMQVPIKPTPTEQKGIVKAIPTKKGIIPPEFQSLIPKTGTAEEFIKAKGLDPTSISIKDNNNFIVENNAGNDAILTELPISEFGKPKFETTAKYEAGRLITDPIEVSVVDGKYHITDGANRFTQAVANKDKTIPVILEIPKLQDTISLIEATSKEILDSGVAKDTKDYIEDGGELIKVGNNNVGWIQVDSEGVLRAIEIKPEFRRQKIATEVIKKEFGDNAFKTRELTDSGMKLLSSIGKLKDLGDGLFQVEVKLPRKPPTKFERRALGIPEEKMITKPESKLLKAKLKTAEKYAKVGYKEGAKITKINIINQLRETNANIDNIKKQVVEYVKENLPLKESGKFLGIIRTIKTQEQLTKTFVRIDRIAEGNIRKTIKDNIIKEYKSSLDSQQIAVDYKDKIKELLNDFELKGSSIGTLVKLNRTTQFIDEVLARGEEIEIPKRIINALDILIRKPFDEISTRQLINTLEEIKRLQDLGKTKLKSIKQIYDYEKEKIGKELFEGSTPINKIEKIVPKVGEKLTLSQKGKNLIIETINNTAAADKALLPMDVIFDWIDGAKGTYDGPNYRLIKGGIDYSFNLYQDQKDNLIKPIYDLVSKYKMRDTNFDKMGFVAHREQIGGIEKLKNLGYTDEEIKAINLTKEEREVLDKMREIQDSVFPSVEYIMRKVYNQPIKKVKNYFSWITDYNAMDEAEIFNRFGIGLKEYSPLKKNVEKGFTLVRKEGGKQKIKINALEIFVKHIDDVSYLINVGPKAKMLFEIVNSSEYATAAGDVSQLLVLEWLDLIVRKGGVSGASQIRILDLLRRKIGAGILGFKLSSAIIQPTTILEGMGMIGPSWGIKGMNDFVLKKEWREFVMKFPELRERSGGETAIQEMVNGSTIEKLQAVGFIPLKILDAVAAQSVAIGAYQKKMAELGLQIDLTKSPVKEAMDYAQLVVRRTQATAHFKDVPMAISRGNLTGNRSLDRALLQFQNFLLGRWSRIRYDALQVGITNRDPLGSVNVLFFIMISALMATGLRMGTRKLRNFITGKEDDDSPGILKNMMYEGLGSVPFIGNILGTWMYDSELMPILDAPTNLIQGARSAINSKSSVARAKGINNFITSLTALLGLPGSMEIRQWINNLIGGSSTNKSPWKGIKSPWEKGGENPWKSGEPSPWKSSSIQPSNKIAAEDLILNLIKKA